MMGSRVPDGTPAEDESLNVNRFTDQSGNEVLVKP